VPQKLQITCRGGGRLSSLIIISPLRFLHLSTSMYSIFVFIE
jgi:hypothetical protein